MSSRRSLTRKAKGRAPYTPSLLHRKLEAAIDSPGGIHKIFTLVQRGSKNDIDALNRNQWSPLVGAIFRLGKSTTRKGNSRLSENELVNVIRICHEKELSLNSGAYFGAHYHRPLTVAAYFGFYECVRKLLEFGALPDLTDGEGKTAWHASFDNPCSSAYHALFRECDRRTASTMLEIGAVTSSLSNWKESDVGSITHINVESTIGSPLYRAILNKRVDVVRFIVENGGSISDREFIILYLRRKLKILLLPLVRSLIQSEQKDLDEYSAENQNKEIHKNMNVDTKYIDWSYPPTWKSGVELAIIQWDNCGLPPNMFQTKVVPFLGHDWFFTDEQLKSNLPRRQSASGEVLRTMG